MAKLRILRRHSKVCRALPLVAKGEWDTPWWIDGLVYRDKSGRSKRGRCRFLLLKCNAVANSCFAEAVIQENEVLKEVR
jgi:hypothetical protein